MRETWASLFRPERQLPPRPQVRSLLWRWGLAAAWYLFLGLTFALQLTGAVQADDDVPLLPPWLMIADLILGAVSLGLVAFRRRWPLPVAVATGLISLVSMTSIVPAQWAFLSLAARRHWRQTIVMAALAVAISIGREFLPWYSLPGTAPFWTVGIGGVVWATLMALLGAYVGVRHDRVADAEARAEERERLRELAVANERNRIAREMHDVLAHRISLVAMHAGVLAYRQDLSAEQTREIAGINQDNAHASLSELRAVLRSLRAPDGAEVEAPQPTLDALPLLVEEAGSFGQAVQVADHRDAALIAPVVSRHAYRIVQECLTNARKHAAGAPVTVSLDGSPERGLTLRVSNPLAAPSSVPGAGLGLVGIEERVTQVGGRLVQGPRNGRFDVEAWLPWTV